ncbi:zinc finger protein 420-like [Hypanus sabinus]|uniref:zinc finger protein 420-like n=1 Tax=Hypanus sabinus TaxID=79690 RepID=UPI0028C490D4|nr:zinc finger protein 420-like [Hypanus sabinus]XP_059817099.1 zinc finger protein 420-like [Hypanus sabinus]XP_059817466.1 zinc finger protein 420-like [Hypanus sabinus]
MSVGMEILGRRTRFCAPSFLDSAHRCCIREREEINVSMRYSLKKFAGAEASVICAGVKVVTVANFTHACSSQKVSGARQLDRTQVINWKEFVSRNLKHDMPVLLSLSGYLRSGARDSIDHPSCSDCGEGFTRAFDQLTSPSFYTGKRPLTCSDSGSGFTRSSQLKVSSHWARPFSCSVCEKGFRQSSHLWTQYSVHTRQRLSSAEFLGKDALSHLT